MTNERSYLLPSSQIFLILVAFLCCCKIKANEILLNYSSSKYLYDSWRAPTEDDFDAVEKTLGVKLPPIYRDFLACQNGGSFSVTVNYFHGNFPFNDESSDTDVSVKEFYSIGCPTGLEWRDVVSVAALHRHRIPEHTIPIAGTGEDLILLNVISDEIFYWERDLELVVSKETNCRRIACSLREFFAGLVPESLVDR